MKKLKRYDIGLFWKGKKQPLSVRKKNSLSLKKAYSEGRHKKVWLGKHFSEEHREKLRKSNIRAWKNKELINNHKKIMKKRWKNKKEREKHSKILKKVYENPELRAKIALKLIKIKRKPSEIKKAKQKAREIWKQKPYLKEKCKKGLELYLLSYNLKKLLGKKENIEKLKTLFGFIVKSKYEKNLADFLYLNKINAQYERYALFFPEMFCIPDFYLPKFNIFIEVYGQHPDAERKKRIKIRVYRKYKIPVIELTPSEFRNLNYFVLSELKSKEMIKKAKKFDLKLWTNPLNNEIAKELKRKNPLLFKEYMNLLVKNKL